jgi:hypothetical protein
VKGAPGAYDFVYTFHCSAGKSPASSVILAESKDQSQKPYSLNSFLNWKEMKIKAGETITLKL